METNLKRTWNIKLTDLQTRFNMDDNLRLAKFLSQRFDTVSQTDALNAIEDFQRNNIHFTNDKVRQFYEDNGCPDNVRGTGPNGKVKMDDVRRALGVETKSRTPDEFASSQAKDLAKENGLSAADFPDEIRTGSPTKAPLASGCRNRISILDVRAAISKKGNHSEDTNLFSSPAAAQLAGENDLSPSDFDIKGRKITKKDIKELIAKKQTLVEE